jgi:hypothetical protein
MTISFLDKCLEVHRSVTGIKGIEPIPISKTKYTWSRHVSDDRVGACKQCRLYRSVALSALDNIQDLRHHVEGLEASYECRADMTVRRAAGFFGLYEAAMAKEIDLATETPAVMMPTRPRPQMIREYQFKARAASEKDRLNLGPNPKWTAGPPLTTEEVLKLDRPRVTRSGRHHSGYQLSLPSGHLPPASEAPSISPNTVASNFSGLADDIIDVPDLDMSQYPDHFEWPPLRHHYDSPPPVSKDIPTGTSWLLPPGSYVPALSDSPTGPPVSAMATCSASRAISSDVHQASDGQDSSDISSPDAPAADAFSSEDESLDINPDTCQPPSDDPDPSGFRPSHLSTAPALSSAI